MRHRHSGPPVKYRTRRNNIRYRQRPMHVQTLIFPKNKFNRKKALDWAKDHGFEHYTSREEGNTIRIRQFLPSEIKRVGGTFPIGNDVKGLYVDRKEGRRQGRRFNSEEGDDEGIDLIDISNYKFGSIEWQDAMLHNIREKLKHKEDLSGAEETFLEIQHEHNIKYDLYEEEDEE